MLRRHAGVADVVVVGSKGPLGEEIVKAVVVRTDENGRRRRRGRDDALRHELLTLCRAQLAVYKVPRVVEFRAEIPAARWARSSGSTWSERVERASARARAPARPAVMGLGRSPARVV